MDDLITYMGYEWIMVDGNVITIGINEEGLEELNDVVNVDLPAESDVVAPDEICGEIATDQGPLNLYSPVDGKILEVNEAAQQNPSIIIDDCYGDGWLFKVEVDDLSQVEKLSLDRGDEEMQDDEDED